MFQDETMMFRRAAAALALAMGIGSLGDPACAQGLSPEMTAQAEAHFKAADTTGRGRLDAAGFRHFITLNAAARIGRAAEIVANNAYSRVFSAVDANQDGFITWAEFLAAQRR